MRGKSVIKGTTVDVSHLAREIQADVAKYQQYKAEDEMKKRAIHASKDYSEFRNFVSVSQLKSMSGSDISGLFNGATASFTREASGASGKIRGGMAAVGGIDDIVRRRNDAFTLSKSVAIVDKHLKLLSLGNTPPDSAKERASLVRTAKSSRSVDEFMREWKRQCTSEKASLSFLTRIDSDRQLILEPDVICKEYFSTDIDSDIVGDVIAALHLLIDMKEAVEPYSANANASGSGSSDHENESFHEATGRNEIPFSDIEIIQFTRSWLKALSSAGRFELSISFLMPAQRLKLNAVCNFLQMTNRDRAAVDELLRTYFKALL